MKYKYRTTARHRRRLARAVALVACLGLAIVGPAVSGASAQNASDRTGSQVTDFVDTLTVAKFDTALGELVVAEISASGEFQSRLVELTNDSGEAADFTVSSTVGLCVGEAALVGSAYVTCEASAEESVLSFDTEVLREAFLAVPVGGTRSSSGAVVTGDGMVRAVTDVAALERFKGPGSLDFLAATLTEFSATGGGGNQTVIIETFADVAIDVRYLYAAVDIDTVTNGVDGAEVEPGSTVTWKYTVTNTGSVDLQNLVVTDDVLGPICVIATLAVGGMDMCEHVGVAGSDPFSNNGSVLAQATLNPLVDVAAEDPTSHIVLVPTPTPTPEPTLEPSATPEPTPTTVPTTVTPTPTQVVGTTPTAVPTSPPAAGYQPAAIDIEVATNGIDADSPNGPTYNPGGSVTWTYLTVNRGTVDLTDVVVTDDLGGRICTQAVLAVAESFSCQVTGTACAGQQIRTGSVVATSTAGVQVRDLDLTHHNCDVAAAPGPELDEVQGVVVVQGGEPLALTGGNAEGPVALAAALSFAGIVAIGASEAVRRRREKDFAVRSSLDSTPHWL